MNYNKNGHAGFTDHAKGRTAASVQSCPVCLRSVSPTGATLPDGSVVAKEDWVEQVCKSIKDDTVNGGYQAGCCAGAFPPF
ncbi:MAG TPA: hypothetical protein VGP06_17640 [Janthinobacterium sp.]|nr:hypothetical protein [Janthinobacterium sp.]